MIDRYYLYALLGTESFLYAYTRIRKIKLIHKNVRKIKDSEKMGVKFMQRWEEQEMIRQEGLAEGIKNFIQELVEEQFPKEKIIEKLKKRFSLTEEEAQDYFEKFS